MSRVLTLYMLFAISQYGNCQVGESHFSNNVLDRVVQIYIDSIKIKPSYPGVLVLEFTTMNMFSINKDETVSERLNGIFYIFFTDSEFGFKKLPSFIYQPPAGRSVFIYSGIEAYTKFSPKDLEKFIRPFQGQFVENSDRVYPGLSLRIMDDSIEIIGDVHKGMQLSRD